LGDYWSVGPTAYAVGLGGELEPRPTHNGDDVWDVSLAAPLSARDVQFRRLQVHVGAGEAPIGDVAPNPHSVGTLDPERLPGFGDVSAALAALRDPGLPGADARSRKLLGDRPLEPNGNLAGYLTQPPLMLTDLRSLPAFEGQNVTPNSGGAPISAI